MPKRWNRIGHDGQVSTTRARPWRGVLALVGVLLVVAALVTVAGLKVVAFAVKPMSPVLAGQVAFSVPTPKPGRSPRWNDPPATTAAGSWGVSVLGADLLSGQVVTLEMEMDEIGQDTVISDALEFEVYERDAGWAFSLPLKPRGAGDMAFSKCPAG